MGVATLVISLFSLLTPGAAVVISYRADVHSRMPVLISPASDAHAQTLTVRNLGNGPALNIAVTEIESAGSGTKSFGRNLVAELHLRELDFAPRVSEQAR